MLSVIMGNAEFALTRLGPDDPLREELNEILDAGNRSVNITRQLLAFARKQPVAPEIVDLNESVAGTLKMLRRLIGENIELSWNPGYDLWHIKIDPSQIDQILAILCVNARDAITNIGRFSIETGNMTFDKAFCSQHAGAVPGDYVLISVSDNGSGMDKTTLEIIFEPFFTTKALGEGTGLGLSTVYGIVKQNNGYIDVYSEVGIGTTFKVYLPRHAGSLQTAETEDSKSLPYSRGETVLVVEDDSSILKLAIRLLNDLKYNVLSASSPLAALKIAKDNRDDLTLLLTDVVMPELDGKSLADKISSLIPELKVIFMSGYTADVIANRGVLKDGLNFIQKPFSRKILAHKLREVLDN
jgi:CheY-like chemotaxis protein